MPAYLDRQRWYADKLRPVRAIEIVDVVSVETGASSILLLVLRIEYETGDARRYFVPVTVQYTPPPERFTIARAGSPGDARWIQDALGDASFRDFLVAAGHGLLLPGGAGTFEFEPWLLDGQSFVLDPATRSSTAALEQSNSSIEYGTQAIAKIYRRLEPGQNIEVDMNRYLATEAQFAAVPKLIGAVTYRGHDGDTPLALVQQHVGDHRDCWSALTEQLHGRDLQSLDLVGALGTVTGEMHVALAGAPLGSKLAPEPIDSSDIQQWEQRFLTSAEETDWMVGERLVALPNQSQQSAYAYLALRQDWQDRAGWYQLLAGCYKTRVHGDYHLGQVLLTRDGRLLVVDFEGEPQRPAYEREAKYSPLKDLAGMLRSLNYATGMVAGSLAAHDSEGRVWLSRWEADARERFLTAYRTAIAVAQVPIAPAGATHFARAVSVLETDKAFYEVRYELSSRPDWAWIPLDSFR